MPARGSPSTQQLLNPGVSVAHRIAQENPRHGVAQLGLGDEDSTAVPDPHRRSIAGDALVQLAKFAHRLLVPG